MSRNNYPWAKVSGRARTFATAHAPDAVGTFKPTDTGLEARVRDYLQAAWQIGFEAGRDVQRKIERKKRP